MKLNDQPILASGHLGGKIRLWEPASGECIRSLKGLAKEVYALCPLEVNGRQLLASSGKTLAVVLWDPVTGDRVRVLQGHTDWGNALCPIEIDGRQHLASAGEDRTVRIWDPENGRLRFTLPVHYRVKALTAFDHGLLVILTDAGLLCAEIAD